jgi:hypothetical protein
MAKCKNAIQAAVLIMPELQFDFKKLASMGFDNQFVPFGPAEREFFVKEEC